MDTDMWMKYNMAMDEAPDMEPDQDMYADLREQREEYFQKMHDDHKVAMADEEEEEDYYEHMARTRWIPATAHERFEAKNNDWAEREREEDIYGYGSPFMAVSEEVEESHDSLDPKHYNELPEELQHWNVVPVMGWDYYIGNATKYLWRAGRKSSGFMSDHDKEIEDLRKSIVYINKRIAHLGG